MRVALGIFAGAAIFAASGVSAQVAQLPGTAPVGESVSPAARNPATAMPRGPAPRSGPMIGDRAVTGRSAVGTANPGATLPGTVSPNTMTPPVGSGTDAGVANGGRVGSTLDGGAAVNGSTSTAPPPPR